MKSVVNIEYLKKKMSTLPTDVIRENIIPYVHESQSEELREDIHSFFITRDLLLDVYNERYKIMGEVKEWLQNDIIRFMNDDIATMFGYTHGHLNKFRRMFSLKDKSDKVIQHHIKSLVMSANIMRSIHNQIGTMTCLEREKLISFVENFEIEELMDNPYYNLNIN